MSIVVPTVSHRLIRFQITRGPRRLWHCQTGMPHQLFDNAVTTVLYCHVYCDVHKTKPSVPRHRAHFNQRRFLAAN